MSQSNTDKNITKKNDSEKPNIDDNDKNLLDGSTEKAIEQYRKIREDSGVELTEKQIAEIDKQCEIIRNREIITQDTEHSPIEITTKNDEIVTGPPTLTRFEKARVLGARTLQLSLGAPSFIEIPKTGITSLQIAMMELEQRLLPIVIKRTLPNGNYQNIPMNRFE